MDNTVKREMRDRLAGELAAVLRRLRELGPVETLAQRGDPDGPAAVLDEADEVQTSQAQELAMASRERLTERLQRLQAAAERLERGEYGRCVECGRPIGRPRLAAIPEVETCLACQERRERAA
jgi:DnaK suppressor protein